MSPATRGPIAAPFESAAEYRLFVKVRNDFGKRIGLYTYAVIFPRSWRKKISAIVTGATHSALPANQAAIILEARRLP